MMERRCLGLVIPGLILIALSLMLAVSGATRAGVEEGTWVSTVPGEGYVDETWPATFHYDVRLTLSGGTGTFRATCSDVDINQPGWESALGAIGKVSTYTISYGTTSSGIILKIPNGYGGTYNLAVTISGDRMTGSGSYTDVSYVTNSWTIDLKREGGGTGAMSMPGIAGAAGAAAIGGFLVGFSVSLLPAPRFMGGSILPAQQTALGTPYAPSQSLVVNHEISSMANQRGGVTRPLPEVPRMRMQFDPIQFPNVEMGKQTDVRPTEIHPTDVLSRRPCPNCGAPLIVTAAGWSCPFCNRAPPGGLDR